MKTLTTLTAVAALITGVSIASAQMSPSSNSPSSGASNARQAMGNGKFCIETSKGGSLQCKYASITECQKDAQAQGLQCAPNPKAGTTGSKQ